MKKGLVFLCCMAGLSFALPARDIKTNDGNIYKDVSITSVTPVGIDISFQKKGVSFVRLLRFTNLSKELQKEFNYNPQKAEKYQENLHKHAQMVIERHAKELENSESKDVTQDEELSRIVAGKINAVLKVDSAKPDGVIAYTSSLSSDHTSTSGYMGELFIYGLMGLSGAEEARDIYPTGLIMHGFPCYAITPEQALILRRANGK